MQQELLLQVVAKKHVANLQLLFLNDEALP
jgi:hypothetical protein